MDKIMSSRLKPYYTGENETLYLGDSLELLKRGKKESIDLIFADPPYFLSGGGITCQSGQMVSVNKGGWDESVSVAKKHEFNRKWIRSCKRLLKPNGTIWISGTFHNIYSIGMALEQEGYKILNNITWQKTNPPPNLACKCFTHSTETILWARKDEKNSRQLFHYETMKEINGGKQMKDVWVGSLTKPSEKKEGRHPTQKPEYLLERILRASTSVNDVVLDPFCGSGTTGVVAKKWNRSFIGMDSSEEFLELTRRRLENVRQEDIVEEAVQV